MLTRYHAQTQRRVVLIAQQARVFMTPSSSHAPTPTCSCSPRQFYASLPHEIISTISVGRDQVQLIGVSGFTDYSCRSVSDKGVLGLKPSVEELRHLLIHAQESENKQLMMLFNTTGESTKMEVDRLKLKPKPTKERVISSKSLSPFVPLFVCTNRSKRVKSCTPRADVTLPSYVKDHEHRM